MADWKPEEHRLDFTVCHTKGKYGMFEHRYTDDNSENKRLIRETLEQMSEESAQWLTRFCRAVCDVAGEGGD